MAMIAILMGAAIVVLEREARPRLRLALLQPADDRAADALGDAVPCGRVADDPRLVERRAEHRGMRDLAADAAADAAVEHRRDRVGAQRVGVRLDRERRAAREPDARMVAGAGVGVDAEALAHDALSRGDRLLHERLDAPLPVELALRLRDQHLRAFLLRGQRLA